VRSRVFLAIAAWLLGACTATAGSLYAVGQLGNSLLAVPSKQLSVTMVNAALARESRQPGGHPSPSREATHKPRRHLRKHPSVPVTPTPTPTPTPSSPAGVLLTSPDGTAVAVCGTQGAYLDYWSPEPGFEADDVNRGPAAVASVLFRGSDNGILMRVTCQNGTPVKHLSQAFDEDDGPGDDD
jgi:hypothetical protein